VRPHLICRRLSGGGGGGGVGGGLQTVRAAWRRHGSPIDAMLYMSLPRERAIGRRHT